MIIFTVMKVTMENAIFWELYTLEVKMMDVPDGGGGGKKENNKNKTKQKNHHEFNLEVYHHWKRIHL